MGTEDVKGVIKNFVGSEIGVNVKTRVHEDLLTRRKAIFSDDLKYRYVLEIQNRGQNRKAVFIMLNPSVADELNDDPTVRRCRGYANLWGYGNLVVLNIFALRSTDPDLLYSDPDPIGPENNINIQNCSKDAGLIVCAWGAHGEYLDRGTKVLEMLRHKKPHYLKLTKKGMPQHPLYLKGSLKPKLFLGN